MKTDELSDNSNFSNYMNSVEKSLNGTPYSEMARNNPYLTYDYNPTFWDKIGNFLNFNTTEDRVRMQNQQAAKDYASQLLQLKQENEFNSPSEQAQRMREAGQNPDLLGTSGVSSAAEFSQEQTSPDYSQVGQPAEFKNFFTTVFSALNSGLNIAERFGSLFGLFQEIEGKSYDNASKATSIGEYIKNKLPFQDDFDNLANVYYPYLFGSYRNKINRSLGLQNFNNAGQRQFWEDYNIAHSNKQEYFNRSLSKYSEPLYGRKDNFGDLGDMNLSSIIQPIVDLNDKILESKLKNDYSYESKFRPKKYDADYSQYKFNEKYFSGLNPDLNASAQNSQFRLGKAKYDTDLGLNETYRKIVANLSKDSKNGSFLASAVLLAFSAMNSMNFSLYKGPKGLTSSIGF